MTAEESKMDKRDWAEEAKNMLRGELKRRGMTYKDLVDALSAVGVQETEANLRNKVSRGNFSAAFFLQTLDAMGCTLVPSLPSVGVIKGRAGLSSSLRQRIKEHRHAAQTADESDEEQ